MTAGFDRYFQIAPCFRDEDARGDRSPGEFYQLDMEMAFASQEDVFAVLEDVLPPIFAKYGTYHIASDAPFRRIPYRRGHGGRYGSDKPDLRIDLKVQDVTELLSGMRFWPLRGQCGQGRCRHRIARWPGRQIDKLCAEVEVQAGNKPYWFTHGRERRHCRRHCQSSSTPIKQVEGHRGPGPAARAALSA